jgi:TonB dependent receptor/CarboxypepD_reg-like domain/TonB-dependent Receptor Plug Domain
MKVLYAITILTVFFSLQSVNGFAQNKITITGKVTDYDSKEPIADVSIVVSTIKKIFITNDSGRFSLPVFENEYSIVFSRIGYFPKTVSLLAFGKIEIEVLLKKKPSKEMEDVTITGKGTRNKVKENEMGLVKINVEKLKQLPTAFGEADILKAVAQQPGVTVAGEGAGGIYVRGGSADQNLVLLDEAPLFNTSHLLGFYTTVSPDVLQNVSLYKGSLPAQYGGRISSLMNINVKQNTKEDLQYTGGISIMSSRFFASGALKKDKVGITVGGRIAYPNLLFLSMPKNFKDTRAFFYDGLLKLAFSGKDSSLFTITAYRSFDKFRLDPTTVYKWKSNVVTLNYFKPIYKKWNLQATALHSDFTSDLIGLQTNYESVLSSSIAQKELKASINYQDKNKWKLSIGGSGILYNIAPGTQKPDSDQSQINNFVTPKEKGIETAAFINSEYNITKKLTLTAGLRFANYSNIGEKTLYKYAIGLPQSSQSVVDSVQFGKNKKVQTYNGLEPRLSLKYLFTENASIKIGYHKTQQFLHLVSNTIAISPVDFWKLADPYLPQQVGEQYSAGLYKNSNKYQYSVEGYYKEIKNMIDYKNGASLFLNKFIESALLPAKLYSYGVEFNATKSLGKLTGEVNYAYTRSFTKVINQFAIDAVNKGEWFPSNQDRPHNINVVAKVKLDAGWAFHTNFVFVTGRPTTFPDGTYVIGNNVITNFEFRNLDRLPNYHRLDIGFSCVTKRFSTQRVYSVWNFSFYNIYSRANAYSIFFKREGTALNAYRLSVIGSIIPSLSWNFHF